MRFDPKFPCPQLTFCRLVEMKCRYRAFFTASEWAFHLPWVLWTRGQQPSRSRILPSCDQYTCLPCDSLALENKLELPCMAFPGKFNELQERNVANYSMPNFPSFVYLFIYSWILQYVDGFLFFLSILVVCFQGFICRKILDVNCQWRLSIGVLRICFYYFDGLAEKLRHTSVSLRVLKIRVMLHFFTPYSRFTCLISTRKYIDISKSVIYSRRATCRKM